MPANEDHSRSHLLGVLALRMEFVSKEAMRKVFRVWELDQTRPIGSLLIESGDLHPSRVALLETLVDEHIHVHGEQAANEGNTISDTGLDSVTDLHATLKQLLGEPPHLQPAPEDAYLNTIVDPQLAPAAHEAEGLATIADSPENFATVPPRTLVDNFEPTATLAGATHAGATSYPAAAGSGFSPSNAFGGLGSGLNPSISPLRYTIIKHHAKGGLGDVYVARDKELAREVALKEIQERYADRTDSRQRFVFEAEITGRLEHPGIVPVYGLGAYADGRPYYAMKFISGQTMRDAIDDFHLRDEAGERDSGEREVALRTLLGQFIDTCNAIGYAHSRGILHRDIKPGNVMLGKFGETLVVDWGLAKALDRPDITAVVDDEPSPRISTQGGSTPTMAGSAIGTPQFMSPEQAAGQLEAMGPAADIYSLGATLYALLAGEPAFRDPSAIVVIDKVKKGEFKPPRQINSKVPAALDAICMKAMALRPEDRYASTGELVVDIEHWLADEPVSVYREPFAKRLQRWAKRHRQAVAGGVAVALTLIGGLFVSNQLIARERDRAIAAEILAEDRYVKARTAVETMLEEVAAIDLADVPLMEPVRKRMLTSAASFYEEFLKTRSDDPKLRLDIIRANGHLGDIHELLGDYRASEDSYKSAISAYAQVNATQKSDDTFRRVLASSQLGLGLLLKKSNRFREAESNLRDAISTRDKVAKATNTVNDRRESAINLYHLGAILARQKNRNAEDEKIYRQALAELRTLLDELRGKNDSEVRRDLARNLNNLGILLRTNDQKAALETFNEAYRLQTVLEAESPNSPAYLWQAARSAANIGGLLMINGSGDAEKARSSLTQARDRFQRLAADFPKIPDYRQELAATENNLSQLALDDFYGEEAKSPDKLEAHFAESKRRLDHCVALRETLVRDFLSRPDYAQSLAIALRQRAELLRLEAQQRSGAEQAHTLDQANQVVLRSIAIQNDLTKQHSDAREYDLELARSYDQAGKISALASLNPATPGRLLDAIDQIEHAIELTRKLLDENATSKSLKKQLGLYYQRLAFAELDRPDVVKAAGAIEAAAALLADDPTELEISATIYAKAHTLALAQPNQAEVLAKACVALLEQAIKLAPIAPDEFAKPVYDPLRNRDDFKRVIQANEAKAKASRG